MRRDVGHTGHLSSLTMTERSKATPTTSTNTFSKNSKTTMTTSTTTESSTTTNDTNDDVFTEPFFQSFWNFIEDFLGMLDEDYEEASVQLRRYPSQATDKDNKDDVNNDTQEEDVEAWRNELWSKPRPRRFRRTPPLLLLSSKESKPVWPMRSIRSTSTCSSFSSTSSSSSINNCSSSNWCRSWFPSPTLTRTINRPTYSRMQQKDRIATGSQLSRQKSIALPNKPITNNDDDSLESGRLGLIPEGFLILVDGGFF